MHRHFITHRSHVDRTCAETGATPEDLVTFARARRITPDDALRLAAAKLTPRRIAVLEAALRTARGDVFSDDAEVAAVAQGVIVHATSTLAPLWTLEAGTVRAASDAALLRTWN